jgi:hypothetical protein
MHPGAPDATLCTGALLEAIEREAQEGARRVGAPRESGRRRDHAPGTLSLSLSLSTFNPFSPWANAPRLPTQTPRIWTEPPPQILRTWMSECTDAQYAVQLPA